MHKRFALKGVLKFTLKQLQHSSEISPTNATIAFYSSQWLYSTRFGRQSHPSSGVHMLYMATGKLAHLGCKFVSSKVVLSLWSCR